MAGRVPVHFFDLHSSLPVPSRAWSPNTLKIRLALNYKGIPYTQTYVHYPDIVPILKSLDVPPHPAGTAPSTHTVPAIVHPSVTSNRNGALMDSLPIARHLEEQFPERSLFPSGNASYAVAVGVEKIMRLAGFSVYTLVISAIKDILDPRDQEYYDRTRSAMFGKPFAGIRPTDEDEIKEMIEKGKKEMSPIVQMLKGKSGKTGPFIEGEQPSYADFIVVGFLRWWKIADERIWEEIVGLGDGEIKALWDACLPWAERQGEEKEWAVLQEA